MGYFPNYENETRRFSEKRENKDAMPMVLSKKLIFFSAGTPLALCDLEYL
jgi:hypothetical protein